MSRRWRWIVPLLMGVTVIVLGTPYALSAYHLQAGGRALERALGRHDAMDWWYVGPREVRDERALQAAIDHLEKARRSPYAQRLLGQAYVAQGQALRGVQALEQFVERRPRHYLAQLELAAAYVYADARLHELKYLDLLDQLDQAEISAPDLLEPMRYTPEDWQNEYVYPTAYSLPPEYGDRPTLFVHAGSQVTWTVTLTQPSVLRFAMGQAPQSLGWGGDGATFEVWVEGERVFLEHLGIEQAREGWHEREADLTLYAGQTIRLSLATTPGPSGDMTGDWAGWGEPRIEDAQAAAYRQAVKDQPWRAKWNKMGFTAQDGIEAGEAAREAGQYETALTWYQWSERLPHGEGNAWYYRGLLHEEREQWAQALDAYARAVEIGYLEYVPNSSPYYRSGIVVQRRLPTPRLDTALAFYDQALAEDEFASAWEKADAHYRRAEILRAQNADPELYVAGFQQAIEIYAEHSGAHTLLGISIYERDQDLDEAEAELRQAIELAPRNKWSYYYLGRIYEQEGLYEQAEQMYARAVEIDASWTAARERLEALRAR